jgi:hypothetical protein
MAGRAWADEVARRDAVELAGRIGLATCPACGHTPSRDDRRAARFGSVRADGTLWTCYACQAGGNSLTLLAYAVLGRRAAGSADWRRLESAARSLWAGLPVGGVATVQPVQRLTKGERVRRSFAESVVANQMAAEAAAACGLDPEDAAEFYPSALRYVRGGGIAARQRVADEIEAASNRARGRNV